MTWNELLESDKPVVSVYDVAPILECDPQILRDGLDLDDDRPIELKRFLFPHCKVGNRRKICREGFVRWMQGDLSPALHMDPGAPLVFKAGGTK